MERSGPLVLLLCKVDIGAEECWVAGAAIGLDDLGVGFMCCFENELDDLAH